jgi:dihydrofolate synthase / folylpolyglutamate synthase
VPLPHRAPLALSLRSAARGPVALAYPAAVEALAARGRFGIRLGLGRTRALLEELGQPQAGIRGALIAGTNGKGSVQAFVSAMLASAGLLVGQAPKPHLVEYRERIVVGGEPIAPGDMAPLVARVLSASEKLSRRLGPATEFELVTAAAFAWFAERSVDLAVVEVGLGGRLDATNAWDGGVAAVTNVAMDHAEILGSTIPLIAREKAAIIKRGDWAVTGATGDALAVVRRRARRLGVHLSETAPLAVLGMDRDGLMVQVPGIGGVCLGLLGRHQAANAAVALGVVDALEEAGIAGVPATARREGLERARWPGRLELVQVPVSSGAAPVDVLLDGAHNPDGIGALLSALGELRPSLAGGPVTLLLGIMRDKDVDAMLRLLVSSPALDGARVLTVRVGGRGIEAAELAARFVTSRSFVTSSGSATSRRSVAPDQTGTTGLQRGTAAPVDAVSGSAVEAFDTALAIASRAGGPLVVAGSLYLVGAVRGALLARGMVR